MERVNRELCRQITKIVQEEIDDPAFEFLSITHVKTTADLRECKVYFSLLDEKEEKRAQEALDKMSRFIRGNLGKRVRIKIIPELKFIFDDSMKYSVDIYKKIEEIRKSERGVGDETGV